MLVKEKEKSDDKGLKFQINVFLVIFFLVAGVGTQTHYTCLKTKNKAKKKGEGKDETDALKSWKTFRK